MRSGTVGKSNECRMSAIAENYVLRLDRLIVDICAILTGSESVRSLGSSKSSVGCERDDLILLE